MSGLTDLVDDRLHASLRAAAAAGPLFVEAETGGTVVLHHVDVERLAHDPRVVGIGLALFDLMGIDDGPLRDWYSGLMFTNEGEEHHRLRSLVSRAFTPRSVGALRPATAELADADYGALRERGGGDLVEQLALLPMRVMCRLLGVPDEDVEIFVGWADALSTTFGFMDEAQAAAATQAIEGMLGYVASLAERRRHDPRDDVITALLTAEEEGRRLTHDELVAMVANLIVAGHDTTSSQLGCSLLTLLRHPDEAQRVGTDPDLVPSAVVETIRFEPSVAFVPRVASAELSVAGESLPAGSVLFLATAAANREPGVWAEPDRFDVGRFATKDAPRLLSFGSGPHYCLGAALARLTVEEVVRAHVALGPRIQPSADLADVPWRMVLGRAPAILPVTIT